MPEGKGTDILVLQPFRKRFSKHALRNRQRPSTGPPFFVTATNDDVIASPSSPSFRVVTENRQLRVSFRALNVTS